MKTLKTTTLGVLILFGFLCTTSVIAQQNHPIVGSWTFSEGPSFARMPPDIKEHMDSIPPIRLQFFSAFQGRTLNFLPNGDFVMLLADGRRVVAKWVVEGNVLSLIDPQGGVMQQQIGDLKANRLMLITPVQGEARAILPEVYYTKN